MTPSNNPVPGSRRDKDSPSLVSHYLISIMVGLVCATFAYWNLRYVLKASTFNLQTFLYLAIFVRNTSIAVLFLIRRPARISSRQIKEWLAAAAGTFAGFAYTQQGAIPLLPYYTYRIAFVLMGLAIVLSITAILSLGRSFGVVPANRGIKTGGLYAIVRHPIYACYMCYDIVFLTLRFSWLNLLVFWTFCIATYLRSRYEERVLRQDAAYRRYADKTRYMFFPKII